MVKYMVGAPSWREGHGDGSRLTTNDGLQECNLVNQWRMHESPEHNLELGSLVNMVDQDTWRKVGYYGAGDGSFEKQDVWKAGPPSPLRSAGSGREKEKPRGLPPRPF